MGHIQVTGREEAERVVLCVRDDGIGMKPEQLARVRDMTEGKSDGASRSSGFGLFNVNQRLQLNYGTEYGLQIDSSYGEGTTLTVAIPKNRKKTN